MQVKLENIKLVMWEKTDMPESVMSKDEKGKTVFTKTGNKTEKTTYTFKDEFGEKLVFMGNNDYRNYEGESVTLYLKINYDDFNRRAKVSLDSVQR